MSERKIDSESLDSQNAEVLADIVIDPLTPEAVRIQILNKLLDSTEHDNFFKTIFSEKLSYGECPTCKHENHWLIPEEALNVMNWITNEQDERVPAMTTEKDCKKWQQACKKKKVML